MKRNSKKFIYKVGLLCVLVSTFSCRKIFDLKPVDKVDATNAYQNVYDANAAIIGLYGQFLSIADRYVVLNELRADLMSPTENADDNLKQLNTHTETTSNPWADPKPWYKVILSCNDIMYHFNDMLATGKLKPIDYQERYSDVGALRCWLYLQVAVQYGSVPYITDPLTNLTDLNDASKFPRLTLDQILPKLAAFMNDPARYLDVYDKSDAITASTSTALNIPSLDSYNTQVVFINKYAFKGDINLWAGNYNTASAAYRYLSDDGQRTSTDGGLEVYERFKAVSGGFLTPAISSNTMSVYYTSSSESSFLDNQFNGPRTVFSDASGSRQQSSEAIWRIPFNTTFGQASPFIDIFGGIAQGGKYLIKPSQLIIDDWNNQVQLNGYPYDARGKVFARTIGGQVVNMKQLYFYVNQTTFLPINPLIKTGYFILNRTGAMDDHYAESALNDGQQKVSFALLNVGVKNMFTAFPVNQLTGAAAIPSGFDPTNSEQTFLPFPYDLDARNGGPQVYNQPWYREAGTRTRANLQPLPLALATDPSRKLELEKAILDEEGRELAFEGFRWGDLVRIARRENNPAILADRVYNKLVKENNPAAAAVHAKLLDPANWYMPFKL